VARLGPPGRPVRWIEAADRGALAQAGAVRLGSPALQGEAWARRAGGATRYSLTGLAEGLAQREVMAELAALLVAPLEPWDALVCTSLAAQKAVEAQLAAVAHHLKTRFEAARIPPAVLVTIPQGVHTASFAFDPEARRRWREALGVPADAAAVLHIADERPTAGNPVPMALALQQAARRVGQPLYAIFCGDIADAGFRKAAAGLCPEVHLRFVASADVRAHGPIWSAADVFLSLTDSLEESFGRRVAEAMAAGLPSVVSDWDGHRTSIRHGTDGFRVRTTVPRPGLGADLAFRYAHGLADAQAYMAAQTQFTAVDLEQAGEALAALIRNPELRGNMGAAAQARAQAVFDWKAIVPQHQALWAELARRRQAAPPQPPRSGGDNPWGLDPFHMFAAFATHALAPADTVQLTRAYPPADLAALMAAPAVRGADPRLPTLDQTKALVAALSQDRPAAVGPLLAAFPADQRPVLERGLVWLAKYGLLRIAARPAKG